MDIRTCLLQQTISLMASQSVNTQSVRCRNTLAFKSSMEGLGVVMNQAAMQSATESDEVGPPVNHQE